jgi:hypothetical protein
MPAAPCLSAREDISGAPADPTCVDALPADPTHCQRWRKRRHSFRPAGEPFDPARHGVEPIDERTAKAFVVEHHYSRSYPAARLRVGLFRKDAPWSPAYLAGVAVFSQPMNQNAGPTRAGVAPDQAIELGGSA